MKTPVEHACIIRDCFCDEHRRDRCGNWRPAPWQPTGVQQQHAGEQVVAYFRNIETGQIGFRRPGSRVVYTWEQN